MFSIDIITHQITIEEIRNKAIEGFGDMIKVVVDCKRGIMAIGGELHADEEQVLLEDGSVRNDLWGINLYVNEELNDWIEFDSMINIRPSQGNKSRNVEDSDVQEKIHNIVSLLVK
ncbi:MAG: hypothetical protein KAS32_30815 [Candidatus Peribacteraceae bacterium]|nr:hypothetical protein [Candidatus Peribacteraceae bacterium]